MEKYYVANIPDYKYISHLRDIRELCKRDSKGYYLENFEEWLVFDASARALKNLYPEVYLSFYCINEIKVEVYKETQQINDIGVEVENRQKLGEDIKYSDLGIDDDLMKRYDDCVELLKVFFNKQLKTKKIQEKIQER